MPTFGETSNETDKRVEDAAPNVAEAEASEQTSENNKTAGDVARPLVSPESGNANAAAAFELLLNAAHAPTVRQLTDFYMQDFFERFPHVTDAHPVHILAGKLLEYFGYGLKLSEIARLIEQLGYQHSLRNFTDSVHSALKNKRKATGEIRFNTAKSVWELTHKTTICLRKRQKSQKQRQGTVTRRTFRG